MGSKLDIYNEGPQEDGKCNFEHTYALRLQHSGIAVHMLFFADLIGSNAAANKSHRPLAARHRFDDATIRED